MSKELKRVIRSKQKYPSTQQWLDIQEIKNGIAVLKSGQLVCVVEVQPINFNFMSGSEQDHILSMYKGLLDSLSCHIQMLTVALPINLDRYYDVLQEDFRRCANPDLQVMVRAQEEFVRSLVEDMHTLKKRHFVVVWAPPVQEEGGIKQYLPGKKQGRGSERRLMEYAQQVQGGLESMGIENAVLDDARLTGLVVNMLNPAV